MAASTHTDEDGNVVAVYDDGDLGVYKHSGKGDEAKKSVEANYNADNTSAVILQHGRLHNPKGYFLL